MSTALASTQDITSGDQAGVVHLRSVKSSLANEEDLSLPVRNSFFPRTDHDKRGYIIVNFMPSNPDRGKFKSNELKDVISSDYKAFNVPANTPVILGVDLDKRYLTVAIPAQCEETFWAALNKLFPNAVLQDGGDEKMRQAIWDDLRDQCATHLEAIRSETEEKAALEAQEPEEEPKKKGFFN